MYKMQCGFNFPVKVISTMCTYSVFLLYGEISPETDLKHPKQMCKARDCCYPKRRRVGVVQ